MRLTKYKNNATHTFEGKNGQAVITRNFGCADKRDYWSVSVSVNGQYKKLANRVTLEKAMAMAEAAID